MTTLDGSHVANGLSAFWCDVQSLHSHARQDRQCPYNVTLQSIQVIIVAVEMQRSIYYLKNGKIFRKYLLKIKYMFQFSLQLLSQTFIF
jgi:hypothetical protein